MINGVKKKINQKNNFNNDLKSILNKKYRIY